MHEDKTTMVVQCSTALKDAIEVEAHKNSMTLSQYVRGILASHIGYDITKDTSVRGPRRKYASDKERLENQRAVAKSKRILQRALQEALKHDERLAAMVALRAGLKS